MNGALRVWSKRLAFAFFASGPLVNFRLGQLRRSAFVTILNLHRVCERSHSAFEALRPEYFRCLLDFVCENFRPTTFSALPRVLATQGKPPIILSFDDGYRDFYDISAPMAESVGVSLNQNIIPSCVESGFPPLNVMAQDFVGQANLASLKRLHVPGMPVETDRSNRVAFARALSRHIKYRTHAQQAELASTLIPQFMQDSRFVPTPMMTLEQVRSVSARHELGAHSFDHATMGHESLEYFRADVKRCAEYFVTRVGVPMSIYAFPNGSHKASQVECLRASGVAHTLLVGERIGSNASGVHHRLTFHARSTAEVRFRATGAWFAGVVSLAPK